MKTTTAYQPLVQRLFTGELDLIGDVHGGFAALQVLLRKLGYNSDGEHPSGRRLVFLGDLIDRCEDSPAVFELVSNLCAHELAQCVLGNHELNILIKEERQGAEWFWGGTRILKNHGGCLPYAPSTANQQQSFIKFVSALPVALERDDLRVVHACWHNESINALRGKSHGGLVHDQINQQLLPLKKNAQTIVERCLIDQNDIPIKVVTSGLEKMAKSTFFAGGRPRKTERIPWWETYRDHQAVVFGHYWHSKSPLQRLSKIPSPFPLHHRANTPLGPRHNAWCIDFSNGHRNEEKIRRPWQPQTVAALAALRWPEQEVLSI